jgi:oligoribonuclease NrnB/cAMP/cGMP phosphodiesterase (DHH superfamily)
MRRKSINEPKNQTMKTPPSRIVTRPDFDGIVCAVLLQEALNIQLDIYWVEPNEIQSGIAHILPGDVLANLPYARGCSLWFDHHISNKPSTPVDGAFEVAPSAARVVYKYFLNTNQLDDRYDELIFHTDIIDAALLNQDQVQYPEKYPYILLSMSIKNQDYQDMDYWNLLVALLKKTPVDDILKHDQVKKRCDQVVAENSQWENYLRNFTRIEQKISITDFRSLDNVPNGNRFLTYSIFPQSIASVKIRHSGQNKELVQISIGQSIFNRQCHVNIGKLLSRYGGGGHAGAGGCTIRAEDADQIIKEIIQIMADNRPSE